MKIFFLNLLVTLFISNSFCIQITLKSYSYKELPIAYTPYNVMNVIINQKMFAQLEIGEPKQKIEIPIDFESNNFYITEKEIYEGFLKEPSTCLRISNLYEKEKSKTYKVYNENAMYSGVNFLFADYIGDRIYFNNNIKVDMDFYLGTTLIEGETGELGLQLLPKDDISDASPEEKSFIKKLKTKKIINNYIYSIYFKNKEKSGLFGDEAILLIGEYPHEIKENLGYFSKKQFSNKENYRIINSKVYKSSVQSAFDFSYIYLTTNHTNNNLNKIEINSVSVSLDYTNGGIIGPTELHTYFKDFIFKELINENKCYEEIKSGSFIFFYCERSKKVKRILKEKFPIIHFENVELMANNTIDYKDSFYQDDKYIYCLIIFKSLTSRSWVLGQPFLRKYPFILNLESKTLGFYSDVSNFEINGIKHSTFIIVIIILAIVFISLGLIIGRKICKEHSRKIHANELEESFDYTPNSGNKNSAQMKNSNYGLIPEK